MAKRTIILMEDDDALRELYSLWLENAGNHVIAQANSLGMEELIKQHSPALLISDIVMPESDGFEGIFKALALGGMPIIAISAHETYLDIAEHVVSSCLLKPFSGEYLVDEVNRALEAACY